MIAYLTRKKTISAGCFAFAILLMDGCGLSDSGKDAAASAAAVTSVSVALSGPSVVTLGASTQYTAVVSGTPDQAVSWSVNQISGGNGLLGTITNGGLYSPPASLPSSPKIEITAASVADPSVSKTLPVTIQAGGASTPPTSSSPATAVTLAGPLAINLGSSAQFTATVTGTQDQSVNWSVDGVTGGNSTIGTISTAGMYTPPATMPSTNNILIAASSVVTAAVSGSINATLLEPVPVISSAVGSTQDSGHTYLVDVEGANFVAGATLLVGGVAVATNSVGAGDLQTTIASPSSEPHQITLVVQNPNPGQTESAPMTISLTLPLTTPAAAARFLDQTSFGATAATIAHVQQIGLPAALYEQLNEPPTFYSYPPVGEGACATSTYQCTQSEFLSIALFGKDQLRQRVAMALSELWVAPNTEDDAEPFYLNTLANDVFTNYRTIMQDAALSPSMGSYLNMVNSAKAPAGQIANENFGREIMQLFTIGLNELNADGTLQTDANGNPIPTYTEDQVQGFARALTGWTYANPDGSAPSTYFNYTRNWQHLMVPVDYQHDTTSKTLLNNTTLPAGQTAKQDLAGALDNIFAHPNVGPFVSKQLIQHLVEGNPSPAYVQRVAAVFTNNGNGVRGDMKAVLTAILLDPEARAADGQTGDQADSTPMVVDGGHLREPLLWTANLLRGMHATQANPADAYPFTSLMSKYLDYIGEAPFDQQTVFNFFSPQYLIPQTNINSPEFGIENTATVPMMLGLADYLIHNEAPGLVVDLSAYSAVGQNAGDPAKLVDYLGMVFMHSQMPSGMRNALISAVSAIPAGDAQTRAEVAAYLIFTSAEYKIIH